jgi:hypothetical protein
MSVEKLKVKNLSNVEQDYQEKIDFYESIVFDGNLSKLKMGDFVRVNDGWVKITEFFIGDEDLDDFPTPSILGHYVIGKYTGLRLNLAINDPKITEIR